MIDGLIAANNRKTNVVSGKSVLSPPKRSTFFCSEFLVQGKEKGVRACGPFVDREETFPSKILSYLSDWDEYKYARFTFQGLPTRT